MARNIEDVDLYKMLGVSTFADEAQIRKAYRKKALSCHPDKNPDDPEAAERFQELTSALEVLVNEGARRAYDRARQARLRDLERRRQRRREEAANMETMNEDYQTSYEGAAWMVAVAGLSAFAAYTLYNAVFKKRHADS